MPADCLLGPLNGGWDVGMAVLTSERGHIGAAVIGLERRLEAIAAMGDRPPARRRRSASASSACSAGARPYSAMAQRQGPVAVDRGVAA